LRRLVNETLLRRSGASQNEENGAGWVCPDADCDSALITF
jgi:hypothetical protein